MKYESPAEAELRAVGEALLTAWRADNERLRVLNDVLAGRRPRPQLTVVRGGKTEERTGS
jgi:hypothetical protein